MTEEDRVRWDDRYARLGSTPVRPATSPAWLEPYEHVLPTKGHALDVACGSGHHAVWLASRGLDVWGFDVSPVAIDQARELARRSAIADRCRFDVADLDDGLPVGPPVELVLCHRFRDRRLDETILRRLAPGGLLAISALSEVDAESGPFRVVAGELPAAFARLEVVAAGEGHGEAWLLARA